MGVNNLLIVSLCVCVCSAEMEDGLANHVRPKKKMVLPLSTI